MAGKKGHRQNFWHEFWSAWWQRYPWKLDDSEEPPTDDPDEMERLRSLEPSERTLRGEIEANLTEVRQTGARSLKS